MSLIEAWKESAAVCGAPPDEFSKPLPYLEYYEAEFSDLRQRPLTIVEIGVFRGQFLEALARFFSKPRLILGIELLVDRVKIANPRIRIAQGDQADPAGLEKIFRQHTPDGIDIMFDDASHVGALTMSTYLSAQRWLKSGGIYYVEDWGTGYWPDWPDGESITGGAKCEDTKNGWPAYIRSHTAGMVGFIKSLVDHVGAPVEVGATPISSMTVRPGIVKLVKT